MKNVSPLASAAMRKRIDAILQDAIAADMVADPDGKTQPGWSDVDLEIIEIVCRSADRGARLQTLLDAEMAGEEVHAGAVVRLSAELRLLERQQTELLARLSLSVLGETVKSARHQRAAQYRWKRQRELRG